jgi:hypothetical protein
VVVGDREGIPEALAFAGAVALQAMMLGAPHPMTAASKLFSEVRSCLFLQPLKCSIAQTGGAQQWKEPAGW